VLDQNDWTQVSRLIEGAILLNQADINRDGRVDNADLLDYDNPDKSLVRDIDRSGATTEADRQMLTDLLKQAGSASRADVNQDGFVDGRQPNAAFGLTFRKDVKG
jgi:hypothetical protein